MRCFFGYGWDIDSPKPNVIVFDTPTKELADELLEILTDRNPTYHVPRIVSSPDLIIIGSTSKEADALWLRNAANMVV